MQRSERSLKLGYLAGIIDGEGCFNIAKCRTSFVPRILVTNTNFRLAMWLKKNIGGDVGKTIVKGKSNWKPRYMWRLSQGKATELAEILQPHLIVKEKQARCFMVWAAVRNVYKPKERKPFYRILKTKLRNLNRKGQDASLYREAA